MLGRFYPPTALVAMFLAVMVLMLVGCNGATQDAPNRLNADSGRGFMERSLPNGRHYAIFIPLKYDASRKYPTIVFLHGIGEGGEDVRKPLSVGLATYVAKHADTFDFICIFPQSPGGGWDEESDCARDVVAAIDDTARVYNVDRDRVSLTGVSTGGHGTWAIGAKYSSYFSALAPMCAATPFTGDSQALARMNIWAFENAVDPFTLPMSTQASVGAVRSAGGTVKHTVSPLPGHDCWDMAYSDSQLFAWLKQQHRGGAMAARPIEQPRTEVAASPVETSRQTTSAVPARVAPTVPANPSVPARSTPVRQTTNTTVIPPTVY